MCIMSMYIFSVFFFFFQAEDGIRDLTVTGVQTCALPILRAAPGSGWPQGRAREARQRPGRWGPVAMGKRPPPGRRGPPPPGSLVSLPLLLWALYYGANIGELFLPHYRPPDESQHRGHAAPPPDD